MLLFADSFDHWSSASFLQKYDRVHGNYGVSVGAYGRFGTSGLQTTSSMDEIWKILPAPKSTLIIGMALRQAGLMFAQNVPLWGLRNSDSGLLCGAYLSASGELYVTNSQYSACRSLRPYAYDYFEWKIVIHPSAGSIIIRRNGVELLSQSGINTGGAAASIFTHGVQTPNFAYSALWRDDLYICDTDGSQCNDFLGEVRVEKVLPGGAGTYSQWTPSSGANYACVDEPTPSDADYVQAAALGLKDAYALADLVSTAGIPKAVVVHPRLSKTTAGFRGVKALIRSGSTDQLGPVEHRPGTGFRPFLSPAVFTLDPSTGLPWADVAAINALQAGVEVTT